MFPLAAGSVLDASYIIMF